MKHQFEGKLYDSKEDVEKAFRQTQELYKRELQEKKLREQSIAKGEIELKWLRFKNSFWGRASFIAMGLGALAGFIRLIFWIIERFS